MWKPYNELIAHCMNNRCNDDRPNDDDDTLEEDNRTWRPSLASKYYSSRSIEICRRTRCYEQLFVFRDSVRLVRF